MEIQDVVRFGSNVVSLLSGSNGQVIDVHPWGVRVYNVDRLYEKELWTWNQITVRQPRSVVRHPRPWRFPRSKLSKVCHRKIGRMEVRSGDVFCLRCKNPIGSESYPVRLRRAEKLFSRVKIGERNGKANQNHKGGEHSSRPIRVVEDSRTAKGRSIVSNKNSKISKAGKISKRKKVSKTEKKVRRKHVRRSTQDPP